MTSMDGLAMKNFKLCIKGASLMKQVSSLGSYLTSSNSWCMIRRSKAKSQWKKHSRFCMWDTAEKDLMTKLKQYLGKINIHAINLIVNLNLILQRWREKHWRQWKGNNLWWVCGEDQQKSAGGVEENNSSQNERRT